MTLHVACQPSSYRRGAAQAWVLTVLLIAVVAVSSWYVLRTRTDPQGEAQKPETTPVAFPVAEAAEERGLVFQHVGGRPREFFFPEIMAGGVGLLDYDGDGSLDVYMVQGGILNPDSQETFVNKLFRNKGQGYFEDVTAAAGVGDSTFGMGCAVGDYDSDGDVDLYVTNVGPNVLYRNNGNGTFTDVSAEARVTDEGWGCSAAFLDYDGDNDLDLFVTNYLTWSPSVEMECFSGTGKRDYCKPNNYNSPAADTLYRNNGDGTFLDVSDESGIRAAFGNGLGVAVGDFNNDRRPDIYVANDGMPNQLWINQGTGMFVNEAILAGCAVNIDGASEAGMGVASLDINHDGQLDLFMTHLREETNTLYINRGGWFDDVTAGTGLSASSVPYTGFGLGFADFDHDGLLDLYVANGRVGLWEPTPEPEVPYAEADLVFRGAGLQKFERARFAPVDGDIQLGTGRGLAMGDLDNDGDVDTIVVNNGSRAQLFLNRQSDLPAKRTSIMFKLKREAGTVSGATVAVDYGGIRRTRIVERAGSYLSSHDVRVHFGTGDAAEVSEIVVTWPGGSSESFGSAATGWLYELEQGSAAARAVHRFARTMTP
ncbi:MAG: CRTAC1 family protein [Planctomycetota bacterium]|jgi:hypothetical protein